MGSGVGSKEGEELESKEQNWNAEENKIYTNDVTKNCQWNEQNEENKR